MQILEIFAFLAAATLGAVLMLFGIAHAGGEILPGVEVGSDALKVIGGAALVSALLPKKVKKKLAADKYVGWLFTLVFGLTDVVGANWGGARNARD